MTSLGLLMAKLVVALFLLSGPVMADHHNATYDWLGSNESYTAIPPRHDHYDYYDHYDHYDHGDHEDHYDHGDHGDHDGHDGHRPHGDLGITRSTHFLVGHSRPLHGSTGPIVFDVVVDNTNGGYDPESGVFTTPCYGVFYFTLSGLPCPGGAEVVWGVYVDGWLADRCSGHHVQLCSFRRYLAEHTKVRIEQHRGCSMAVTFSGGVESSYHDLLYDWY